MKYSKFHYNQGNKNHSIQGRVSYAKVTDYKLVCYYNAPSRNKESKQLTVDNIDPDLCTHIIFAFASIVNNSIYLDEFQLNVTKELVNLKNVNKNLKILLSVGGSGNGGGYPSMVKKHDTRKQ